MQFLRHAGRRLHLALLLLVMTPVFARADGFIVINQPSTPVPVPQGHFSFAPLEVSFHHVSVTIKDQVAVTSVDQEFINPNGVQLEGTYLFPLPAGAHIDKFSMDINGKMQEAELLPADKARTIYEDIVRRYKDPALLEYIGRDTFKVRIFPIEANGKKHVKIQYTQLLKSDTGLIEYTYPLNTEKFSARPLQQVSVKVTLETQEPLKSVYCPTHNVEIKRDGGNKAAAGFEDKNVRPDTDFKLIYSRETKDIGVNLMTFRNSPDDGYFLLLASPGMEVKQTKVQPKDICLVLDTSGSMAGKKMEQAKKALAFCLANLNAEDRFNIIRFSTEADELFNYMMPADKENVAKAQAYVEGLKPIGGTAIDEALQKAIAMGKNRRIAGKDRPYVVIFLTDGQPTIGETKEDAILANITKAEAGGTRIFSFGIGTDLNTHLLDRLAEATKAVSQYVIPSEDIEVKLSNFYTKIKDPVLSNVAVGFTGADIKTMQFYPNTMPDLFKGEMLVVFGKYTGKGAAAVKISGTINGEQKEFVTDVNFTDNDTKNEFIPRLWATRRVGWLLDEIRKNGETAELKDEVVRLARQHGIVTPYTAYLILEDEQRRGVPVAIRTMREFEQDGRARDAAKAVWDITVAESKNEGLRGGDVAVANATNLGRLKYSDNVQQSAQEFALDKGGSFGVSGGGSSGVGASDGGVVTGGRSLNDPIAAAGLAPTATPALKPASSEPADALSLGTTANGSLAIRGDRAAQSTVAGEPTQILRFYGYRANSNYAQQARVVRGRAFYQNGNTWTDSTAGNKPDLKKREVKFNSDDYFKLLADHPEAAAWLSLGSEVDLVLDDTLVIVR
ncbi:MAG: vault protein inter-alpha-trypsin protein [Phycisphaerales bacterium]|nr:vault protein inter-alpha-trypsin protein [Phycisphaerales bacterium]